MCGATLAIAAVGDLAIVCGERLDGMVDFALAGEEGLDGAGDVALGGEKGFDRVADFALAGDEGFDGVGHLLSGVFAEQDPACRGDAVARSGGEGGNKDNGDTLQAVLLRNLFPGVSGMVIPVSSGLPICGVGDFGATTGLLDSSSGTSSGEPGSTVFRKSRSRGDTRVPGFSSRITTGETAAREETPASTRDEALPPSVTAFDATFRFQQFAELVAFSSVRLPAFSFETRACALD